MALKIAPAGDRALLVSFDTISAEELHASATAVRRTERVLAAIPGHSSILAVFDGSPDERALRDALADVRPGIGDTPRTHRIDVSFRDEYAPDLPELLAQAGIARDAFIERVSTLTLRARYLGFRAGFAYLDGWPKEWAMPRRPTSRPVAAGSFAIAGAVAGFYPIDSPGGWNILGRTSVALWDERRDPPTLISAGDEIAIRPTLDIVAPRPAHQPVRKPPEGVEIISAPASFIVGAPDWSRVTQGVSPGGAFDLAAAALANRAAGNGDASEVLECALAGPRLRATRDGIASCYGAAVDIRVNGRVVEDARQFAVKEGDEIAGGRIREGLRSYFAFGTSRGPVENLDRSDRLNIRALPGPHDSGSRVVECEVTSKLDRVGIRLTPLTPIDLKPVADLPSCGMQCGTVQLHPDGSLIVMGPDHPVTGGYLQPMTVISADRWKLAQLAPGERVRLIAHSPYE